MSSPVLRHNSARGFTLIEILLAVALVATIAALVFGSLSTTLNAIDATRTNAASEQVAGLPDVPARAAFETMCDYVVRRTS